MKSSAIFLACAAFVHAQVPMPPYQEVALVNGKPVTVHDVRRMLSGAPEVALTSAKGDPVEFLRWTYLGEKLTAEAEKSGLTAKSPYKDRLAWTRDQVLMRAQLDAHTRESKSTGEELRAYYEKSAHKFGVAKVRLVFLSGAADSPAKAKAEALVKQARGGADFARLARQNSEDQDSVKAGGDFAAVDEKSKLPEAFKEAIFARKQGEVTDALYHDGGYYIFQVISREVKPFEAVSAEIGGQIEESSGRQWLDSIKKKFPVQIEHHPFFQQLQFDSLPMPEALRPKATTEEIKPETVLATVGGKPLTAEQFQGMVQAVGPEVRKNAIQSPAEFITQHAIMHELAGMAAAAGLDRQAPYEGRLRYNRAAILTQAKVDEYLKDIVVLPEEQQKAYAESGERFRFANARVLFLRYHLTPPPGSNLLTEDQAKEKMDGIVKEIRAGLSFEEAVTRYSEDPQSRGQGGRMPPVRADDPQAPEEVRTALFSAKAGDLAGPVKLAGGFYLFQVEQQGKRTYEEVKDALLEEIRNQRFDAWWQGLRDGFDIKITDAEAFRRVLAE